MTEESKQLAKLVNEHFELEVNGDFEPETFDTSSMPNAHGSFTLYNFYDTNNVRYKLVEFNGSFPDEEELVTFMKDAELDAIKEYELIQPKKALSGYFLYKLTPITVNGVAQW
jgi:hypothetical protein